MKYPRSMPVSFGQIVATMVLLTFVFGVVSSGRAEDNSGTVRVMTRNLYYGAVVDPIVAAQSFPALVVAAGQFLQTIEASRLAERAAAVAREIKKSRPDLVGIQEAAIIRKGPLQAPPNPATFLPATEVISDQLQLLVKALKSLGEDYEVVAVIPGVDAQLPTSLGYDGRLTVNDAIIARSQSSDLKLSNLQIQGFLSNRSFPTLGGPVVNRRGWASIDVEKHGRKFRFATAHVEVPGPDNVQASQAHDMINGAGNTTLPVVFVGDFNANATTAADPSYVIYQKFIAAGFKDAWAVKRGADPGLTCCQATNLLNPISQLSSRVDLVLFRGSIQVTDIELVGEKSSNRTASGRWPSDHAGVVATLQIPKKP